MDKASYLQLRKKLNLQNKKHMLLKHILMDIGIVVAMVTWSSIFSQSSLITVAGIGVTTLMFRSFAMMHEAVHGVASTNRANDLTGILYGGVALLAFEPWKKAHLEHHYWSGNAKKDPVMALLLVYPRFPKCLTNILNVSWRAWIPTLGILQHGVFWILSFKTFFSSSISWKLSLSMIWPFLFWGGLYTFVPSSLLLSVIVPGVFLYLVTVEVVNLPHHLKLPQYLDETRLPIWEQHLSSRSCIYPKWIGKMITLNFNYHTEHHMFPDAPWYYLEEIHKELKQSLGDRLNTDDQFAWIVENRKETLDQVMAAALEESNLTSFRKPLS